MASNRPVTFSPEAVTRISRVVRTVERSGADQGGVWWRRPTGDDGGDPVRLGKTKAAWTKGTLATIDLYEKGTPPNETKASEDYELKECVNKFADVEADKWVIVARAMNGSWYLISAEC